MEVLSRSQFMTTYMLSTVSRYEVRLTLLQPGFLVRISPKPIRKGRESMETNQEHGQKSRESWARYCPDTSSWKTRQLCFAGDLIEYSGTWPNSGTMQNGAFWALPTLERRTEDNVYGSLLPTPTATDWKGSYKPGQRRGQLTDPAMGVIPTGGKLNPEFVEWLMGWPIGWTDCGP